MSDVSIDKLSLEIDYKAQEASNGLQNLKNTIGELKSVLSGSTTGLTKLSNAFKGITTSVNELSSTDIGAFSSNINAMSTALGKLNTGTIGKDLTKVFKQIGNIPDINKKLDTQTLNEFTGKIKTLSEALVPLAENLKGVGNVLNTLPSKLNKVSNQTSKTTSGMSLMSKISNAINFGAIIYAGKKLGSMVAEFTSQSNKYVEDLNLFNVSMGESTQKAKEWIDTVSQALGLDPADMMRNMGVFNLMAQGFGLASDKAYIMSKNLTQLTYDVASLYNYDFDTASKKIKSAFAGELEPVKSLGFAIDQATLQQIAYANGIDKSFTSMTQAEKAQLRYIALMTQIPQIQGDMARTITSASNSLRIMKQQFTLLGREIGNIFIPLLVKIIPVAIAVTKVLTKIAKAISSLFGFTLPDLNWDSVSATTGTVADDLDDANGSAKALRRQLAGFDELNNLTTPSAGSGRGNDILGGGFDLPLPEYDMLEGLDKGIDDLTDKVMKFFGLTEDESGKLSWSFQDMDKWAKLLAISLGALMGIKLAGKFTSFYKGASEFGGVLKKIGGNIGKFGGVLKNLGGGSMITGIGNLAVVLVAVGSALYFIKQNWEELKTGFGNWLEESGLSSKIGYVKDMLEKIGDKLSPIIDKLGGLKGIIEKIGGSVFFTFMVPVMSTIAGIVDTVVSAFEGLGKIFEGITQGNFDTFLEGVKETLLSITGIKFITSKFSFFENMFDSTVLKGKLKETKEAIGTWFEETKTAIFEKVNGIWEGIKGGISTAWTSVVDTFTNIFVGIADWFNINVAQPLISFFQPVIDFFSAGFKIIGELAEGTWNLIKIVWGEISNWTNENVITPVSNFFNDLFSSIGNWAKEKWEGIKGVWGVVSGWFSQYVVEPVKTSFGNAWDNLKSGASKAFEGVKSVFSPIANWFRDKFAEAWTNVKNVFSVGGRIFEGIKDAISGVFKNVLNNIINGLNSVIASPFNTINGILDRIQNISIAGAQPFAGLTTRLPVPQIPNVYAEGGFPDTGEFFMARENGIPEMVGKIGNRTAVANNTQIVEAIEQGVYRGTASANESASATPIYNVVNIGNRKVYSGVAQNVRTENNRYGVAVLEV